MDDDDKAHRSTSSTMAPSEAVPSSAEELQEPLLNQPPPSYEQAHHRHHRVTRILDRDAAFHQSRGRWGVQHVSREATRVLHTSSGDTVRMKLSKQFWDDWFHFLAYQRTIVLMLILFCSYTAIVFNFAFIYLAVSRLGQSEKINPDGSTTISPFCDMDIHNHMEALYFSLSTMTTIGYGVSDYYFGGCWTPLLLVLAQVCSAITFDAVAIGLLFQRISRGHKRSKTVLLSDKAVIRRVRGVPYLMFRVGELRRHQLLEATVRAYCIRHERYAVDATADDPPESTRIETVHYVTKPVQLVFEEVGSHILMSLPQVIAHRMDDESPLVPPSSQWYDGSGRLHRPENGQSYSLDEMQDFLEDREAEIVVLLEGIDELTGSASQTRHSYATVDLAWNECFVPCVYPYIGDEMEDEQEEDTGPLRRRRGSRLRNAPRAPVCVVDFARFHDTAPAPADCTHCPYVIE